MSLNDRVPQKMPKNIFSILLFGFLLNACSFPTTKEAGIKYATQPALKFLKLLKGEKLD